MRYLIIICLFILCLMILIDGGKLGVKGPLIDVYLEKELAEKK